MKKVILDPFNKITPGLIRFRYRKIECNMI